MTSSTTRATPDRTSPDDIRSIGDIIRDTRNLTADQVESILAYQRTNGVRFGEAAIALGLATSDDVLYALAQQFNYAYSAPGQQRANSELVVLNQPFGYQAESFRAIRAQLVQRVQSEGGVTAKRAVAVVSPDSADGKTYFCANLGIALAQLGKRTLLIDADLRGPRMHEVFDIDNKAGLSGLLAGRRGESVIKSVPNVPNLYVMPVGMSPPNPLELVEGVAFGLLLAELLTKFDHILVDTPAAMYGADGSVIAARCGIALVVARKNSVRVDSLQELVQSLTSLNTKVAGVVVNEF